MKINHYYEPITEAVFKNKPFNYFRQQYHIITTDHEENYYNQWIDYLLDRYNIYKSYKFAPHEAEICSLMDGLEALLK